MNGPYVTNRPNIFNKPDSMKGKTPNLKLFWKAVQDTPEIKGAERTMLIILAAVANDRNDVWPKTSTLMRWCNLSRQGALNALNGLTEKGYVRIFQERGPGRAPYRRISIPPRPPVQQVERGIH